MQMEANRQTRRLQSSRGLQGRWLQTGRPGAAAEVQIVDEGVGRTGRQNDPVW